MFSIKTIFVAASSLSTAMYLQGCNKNSDACKDITVEMNIDEGNWVLSSPSAQKCEQCIADGMKGCPFGSVEASEWQKRLTSTLENCGVAE